MYRFTKYTGRTSFDKKLKKTAIYIKLTSFDAEIGASKEKSHNQHNEWAIPIGVAHFLNEIQIEIVGAMKSER